MTTRRSTLVPVSFCALFLGLVCGLVLGSLGVASAAGLTRGTVKTIAGHVVDKRAPGLSVAHATTADVASTATRATSAKSADTAKTAETATDAGTVGGATAEQLGVRPIVFTIPMGGASRPSGTVFHLLGVPPGTYLVSFSALLSTTSGSFADCEVIDNAANALVGGYAQASGHLPSINANGVVAVGASDVIDFVCNTVADWAPDYPINIAFTPTASAVAGTISGP